MCTITINAFSNGARLATANRAGGFCAPDTSLWIFARVFVVPEFVAFFALLCLFLDVNSNCVYLVVVFDVLVYECVLCCFVSCFK